jgi:PAS domain S-box-containing protein
MLIPVMEFDLEFMLQYANASAKTLFGLSDERIANGIHVDALVIPEQHALVHEGLTQLRDGAKPTSISLRVVASNGVAIPSQVYSDKIVTESKVTGYVAYIVDLARRETVEEKFLSKKEMLEFMVDYYSFSGILIVDDNYSFEYINDKLCDILGRRRSEVVGHDFREFIHPDSLAIVSERYKRRQNGEEVPSVYELKIVRKDGEIRNIRMNVGAIRASDGKIRTVAQLMDITDELQSAQALEASEYRYRSLVETMDSGLAVDNIDGKIVLVNDALCLMLGYDSLDELVGSPITKLMYGWTQNNVTEKVKARREGKMEQYEAQLKHKKGGVVPVMVSASPVVNREGEYQGSMAVFTDISELKKAEAEVRFLLDLLLHDIGNQLQLILAGGDFLESDSPPEQVIRSKRYIMDGALRCLDLIQKVRRAEESKSEPLAPVRLRRVVEAEVELLYKQRGVRADMSGLKGDVTVYADQALSQLVWNLLENAVLHNPKEIDEKIIVVSGKTSGKTYIFTIADNGPGIGNGKKTELFNPARRYGGVGLHLVRRLTEKYSGTAPIVKDRVAGHPEEGLRIDVVFDLVK